MSSKDILLLNDDSSHCGGAILKSQVIGAVVAVDNELCMDIHLLNGSKFQYYVGENIDDELARIVLEMGWN
jgi:hypothetical protein